MDKPDGHFFLGGGEVNLKNIVIEASHADFIGISLQNLTRVEIKNLFMSGSPELIEETSIGKGFFLLNIDDLYLRNCNLINFRLGLEFQDLSKIESRSAKFIDFKAEKCSIGAMVQFENQELKVSFFKIFLT